MHRRKGDVAGDTTGDLSLNGFWKYIHDLFNPCIQFSAAVGHPVKEPLHILLHDTLEIVPDTHVEHGSGGFVPSEPPVQYMNDYPCVKVLIEALFYPKFLGPFAVIALVLHVDAGFGNLNIVECLDCFKFDIARAGQPCCDNILCHLCMWSGSNTCGRLERMSEDFCTQRPVPARDKKQLLRYPEDCAFIAELLKNQFQQLSQGDGRKLSGHYFIFCHTISSGPSQVSAVHRSQASMRG